ncbi:MAG: hypothetical protein ABTQ25_15335 [Nitrosomonas ureae]
MKKTTKYFVITSICTLMIIFAFGFIATTVASSAVGQDATLSSSKAAYHNKTTVKQAILSS